MQIVIFKSSKNKSTSYKINGYLFIFLMIFLVIITTLTLSSTSFLYGYKKGYKELNEDRIEDIPYISNFFIDELSEKQGLPKRKLSQKAVVHLQSRNWPGNIRQLRNVLERSLILGSQSGEISIAELQTKEIIKSDNSVEMDGNMLGLPLREARELFEKDYLVAQINRFGGNISKTSQFVGMERSALHRKLKTLNVVTSTDTGTRVAKTDDVDSNDLI